MSGIDLAFAIALLTTLAAIAVVDFRTLRIPDWMNILVAGLGLLYQLLAVGTFPAGAVVSAIAVFLGFWAIRRGYQQLRGVAGLGFGDVKMAGGAAVWFSPWNLPLFLFAASFSALVFVLISKFAGVRLDKAARIPFGPFIGVGLVVTWGLERLGWPTFIPYGDF